MNSIHNLSSDFFTIHFNIILHSTPVFRKGHVFLLKLCTFLLSPVTGTCPTYLILTALMNLLLCNVSHSYVTFSFRFPNTASPVSFHQHTRTAFSPLQNKWQDCSFFVLYVIVVDQIGPGSLLVVVNSLFTITEPLLIMQPELMTATLNKSGVKM